MCTCICIYICCTCKCFQACHVNQPSEIPKRCHSWVIKHPLFDYFFLDICIQDSPADEHTQPATNTLDTCVIVWLF